MLLTVLRHCGVGRGGLYPTHCLQPLFCVSSLVSSLLSLHMYMYMCMVLQITCSNYPHVPVTKLHINITFILKLSVKLAIHETHVRDPSHITSGLHSLAHLCAFKCPCVCAKLASYPGPSPQKSLGTRLLLYYAQAKQVVLKPVTKITIWVIRTSKVHTCTLRLCIELLIFSPLPPPYHTIPLPAAMNVSCSEYIPHAELSELQKTLFTCYPLYACGASSTATPNEIVWRKFFDFDTLTEFIASPEGNSSEYDNYTLQDTDGETYYPPKNISGQTKRTRISIWDGGHVLNVSSSNADPPGPEALGYYIPTVVLSDNRTVKGSYSVVFRELFRQLD